MILAANKDSLEKFGSLCKEAEQKLNYQALQHKQFKGGTGLEEDVRNALVEASIGTKFAGTIELVSGLKFPDIRIGDHYGVEVKSSNTGWRSVGSSVLETSRLEGIERIYLMYGKLKDPVAFLSRPYEDCLYDVSVTHSPRYLIDMKLEPGMSIFDKMETTYDSVRNSGNAISLLLAYKQSENPNGKAWWSQEGSFSNSSSPFLINFFRNLDPDKQNRLTTEALLLFPEIFTKNQNKFEGASLYWLQMHSVMCHNIRDIFTAGGKFGLKIGSRKIDLPHVFKTLVDRKEDISRVLKSIPIDILAQHWKEFIKNDSYLKELVDKGENLKIFELWEQIVLSQENLITQKSSIRDFLMQEFENVDSDYIDKDFKNLFSSNDANDPAHYLL